MSVSSRYTKNLHTCCTVISHPTRKTGTVATRRKTLAIYTRRAGLVKQVFTNVLTDDVKKLVHYKQESIKKAIMLMQPLLSLLDLLIEHV